MSGGGWGISRHKQTNRCGHPDRKHYAKGLCVTCYRNTPHFQNIRRAYYAAHKEQFKRHGETTRLRRTRERLLYGITYEQYEALLQSQRGLCAICKQVPGRKGLGVDHCHETGQIRGLLCSRCNTALGLLKDRAENCLRAADYLDYHDSLCSEAASKGRAPGA